MIKLRNLLIFLVPLASFAQGIYIPPRTVTGTVNGITRPIAGATITVCAANIGGIPCAPALANTVFKDSGLTVPLSNPFLTDSQGNYPQAALAGGTYTITESAPGFTGFSYQTTVSCAPGASCTITGPFTVNGSATVTGALTAARLFKRCYVDGVTYTTIAGAYNDSTNCLSVWLPPGYTETLSANLVLNRSSVPIVAEGTATIHLGTNQITSAGTINNVSIVAPHCALGSGGGQCLLIDYTGTSQAIVIGDSTTHSKNFYLRGAQLNTTGNGASALRINNVDEFTVADVKINQNGGTAPIGIITNGTGGSTSTGKFDNVVILGGSATNAIGYQFQNLSVHIQIIGGSIGLDTGASSNCLDVQGASTQNIELVMPNFNTCNLAIKVESGVTSVGAVVGQFRIDSGVTTVANFASGTLGSDITCVNCSNGAPVTDSSSPTANSVHWELGTQINSKLWSMAQTSAVYTVNNVATSKQRIGITAGGDFNIEAEGGGGTVHIGHNAGGTGGLSIENGSGVVGTAFNGSGLATTYNTLTTAGTGLAPNLGTPINLTGQVANLGATTIYTTAGSGAGSAGLYRVCAAAWTTSTGNSTVTINAIAPSGSGTVTAPLPQTLNTAAVTNPGGGCTALHAAASSAIQVSVTGYNTTGTYSIQATVEQVM